MIWRVTESRLDWEDNKARKRQADWAKAGREGSSTRWEPVMEPGTERIGSRGQRLGCQGWFQRWSINSVAAVVGAPTGNKWFTKGLTEESLIKGLFTWVWAGNVGTSSDRKPSGFYRWAWRTREREAGGTIGTWLVLQLWDSNCS